MLSFAATLTVIEAREEARRGQPLSASQKARLQELFAAHADLVWRLLLRQGLGQAQADDGLQQVFAVALRRLGEIEAGKERSFLCSCAINVAKGLAQPKEDLPGELPDQESSLDLDEQSDAARKRKLAFELLAKLDEPLRLVLVLQDVEGLTKQETAQTLGIPEGTVASRTRRAREVFKELLAARVGVKP